MRLNRRTFIEGGLAVLALLGFPLASRGAGWPESAFEATASADALEHLFGSERPTPSDAIELSAPVVAEDGSMVPVSVKSTLQGVTSISLIVDKNPRPLTAHFELAPETLPELSCRIKMAETSDLHAVLRTGSGVFGASAHVKITRGGCA